MILGSLLVALCLILMAWASEFVSIFTSPETNKEGAQQATIVVAVLSIYAVDFAINAVQACCRSLIVDTLPIPKQQLGSAWASRMVAIGHLVGYAAGTLDLVSIFGTSLGSTQFKKLVILAITGLLSTVGLTSWAVTERVLISSRGDGRKGKDGGAHSSANPIEIFRKIFKTTANLPPRIQAICWAQFWAWIGWFPFLFYSSTWVGETYYRYDAPRIAAEEAAAASASASQSAYGAEFVTRIVKRMLSTRTEGATAEPGSESGDALGDIGRIGSMALVVFSLVTFASAFLLPLLVRSPDSKADQFDYTPRPPRAMKRVMSWLETRKPDLLTAWFCGHFVFSCAMICAPFASSFRFATVLVAACGIPWVLGSWAPYTFLGVEVNRLSSTSSSHQPYRRLSVSTVHSMQSLNSSGEREEPLRLQHDPDEDVASTGELSGIYFGILNIYTTLPQFVGTFISMIVFAILEPGKSPELAEGGEQAPPAEGVNAIGVCLFIGAISTLGAAVATKKLKKLQ